MTSNLELNKLTDKILNEDLEECLESAVWLGRLLWHNNVGEYSLVDFETKLIDKYQCVVSCSLLDEVKNDKLLFVASECYLSGGHTRLMERLADGIDIQSDLLIIRPTSPDIISRLSEYFSSVYQVESQLCIVDKLQGIISRLCKYDRIILNIHPDDILTTIACGILKRLRKEHTVFYINHADHAFNYGASIADFWFQISAFGNHVDQHRNLTGKKSFLGIPLEISTFSNENVTITNNNFITAGSSVKYKPQNGYSIFPLLNAIMKSNPLSCLIVIGPDIIRDYWWWKIKLKYPTRIRVHKRLPFDKYLLLTKQASAYIDSHPIPGGTAFVEQYLSGMRCVGLISPFQGYTPVELLKVKNTNQAVHGEWKKPEKLDSLVELIHGKENVINRFKDTLFEGKVFENLCERHLPWSGDISYNLLQRFNSISSDFPLDNEVTKYALRKARFNAKLLYLIKRCVRQLSVYIKPGKR